MENEKEVKEPSLITGLFVGKDGTAKYMTIKNELKAYYELLDCELIDMPARKIGRLRYNIICDDEGLLKERPIPTVFDVMGKPMIVGSVFFCLVDDEGRTVSLTNAHMANLADYLFCGIGLEGPRFVMTGADYIKEE